MHYVRSQASYADFTKGRDVDSALHREDGAAGYVVGIVAALRAGDEEITQQQYEDEKTAIQTYNAALPVVSRPSPAIAQQAALEALAAPLVQSVEDVLTARLLPPMTLPERAAIRDGAIYLASRGQFGKQG